MVLFFAEGSAGFGGDNSSAAGGRNANGVKLGLGAGYAYFITQNISVEGLLKLSTITGAGNTANVSANVGFGIYLPTAKAKQVLRDQQ